MKRKFVLSGFIVSSVMLTAYLIYSLHALTLDIDLYFAIGNNAIASLVFGVFEVLATTIALIFNLLCISLWNKSSETFRKNKNKIFIALGLNIFVVLLLIVFACVNVAIAIMSIIAMVIILLASGLIVYDMVIENKKFQQNGKGEENIENKK